MQCRKMFEEEQSLKARQWGNRNFLQKFRKFLKPKNANAET